MHRAITSSLRAIFALALFATFVPVLAQQPEAPFTRTEEMIPMRDGVRLHTFIYTPTRTTEKLPILFLRTPYGTGDMSPAQLAGAVPELAAEGYIIANQDIRGRFKSEGQFVMLRQPRDPKDKKAIDESTDAYDTIEYLLKNTSNNGRVAAFVNRFLVRGIAWLAQHHELTFRLEPAANVLANEDVATFG